MISFRSDREFCAIIKNKLIKVPNMKDYDIQVIETADTNGSSVWGLQVDKKKSDLEMCRVILISEIHDRYKSGESLDAIVKGIIQSITETDKVQIALNKVNIRNYEEMRKCLVFAVMGQEAYGEFITQMPHIEFVDMIVYFNLEITIDENYTTFTNVTDKLLQLWGVGVSTVMKDAIVNTPKRMPPKVELMSTGMLEKSEKEDLEAFGATEIQLSNRDIYIATNKDNLGGAAVILYPNFLKELSDCLEDDLIILPTSVNEVIVMGKSTFASEDFVENCKQMVIDMNQAYTNKEDVLTNSIYTYLRKEDHFGILG